LEEVIETLKKRGVRVILCDANERVKAKLLKAGLLDLLGADNYAETLALVLSRCRAAPGYVTVKQRAKLSSLGVETASKSFHPSM
jgi:SulP family sulfate permease